MNNLEQRAIKSLLNLAGEEETKTQRNWDQTPKQDELSSPPAPKSLNLQRKNRQLIPSQKARQKSSIEINLQEEQKSQLSQKENSVQQLIEEYMKSIQNTQKQMELIHQSKFDIKSGWMRFSSIILEDQQKNQKRRQLSQIELPIKETQKQVLKNASIHKILNNNNFFLPKLKQTYLK